MHAHDTIPSQGFTSAQKYSCEKTHTQKKDASVQAGY
jgi:hypothetical protein